MVSFDDSKFNIHTLTKGALLHPSVQQLLGFSDALFPGNVPRWLAFPVLRLADVIMVGCACEYFKLPATKIAFGSEVLAGAAFALAGTRDWVDSVASYALTGRFNTELGAFVRADPSILMKVLSFRETQAGVNLRKEILQALESQAGSEFVASVNGGLKAIVPASVMEQARDQLSGLLFESSHVGQVVPAVWTNIRNSDATTAFWRARSRRMLEDHCATKGIREYDSCPCGSGEKLKFCCGRALGR